MDRQLQCTDEWPMAMTQTHRAHESLMRQTPSVLHAFVKIICRVPSKHAESHYCEGHGPERYVLHCIIGLSHRGLNIKVDKM